MAQWIRLRLPSWAPGFDPQAHHLKFAINSQTLFAWYICQYIEKGRKRTKKDENEQKEAQLGPYF